MVTMIWVVVAVGNQPTATSARNSHPKTGSVVSPEDGRLTPETCRGLRHTKLFVKVKVY
jgi:hypothetical protein